MIVLATKMIIDYQIACHVRPVPKIQNGSVNIRGRAGE
jgi:hypothetical protein